MLPDFFEFQVPTRVIYGNGITKDLAHELAFYGKRKAFIVTDKIIKKIGLVDKVVDSLKNSFIDVVGFFDEIEPNSDVETVNIGAKKAINLNADMIIAIGGGSPIDTAKGINILLSNGGEILDYQGAQILNKPLKPLIVIPTTAGTGSEVTSVAVITNLKEKVKLEFIDKFLRPDLAILDPQLTLSMPPKLIAASGMDALTHAIEAYFGLESSPASDAMAIQAIKIIVNNIENAVKDPNDINSRGSMLIASTLAGISFSHSMVGIIHGMAHSIGGILGAPHGVVTAILLPWGMEYNLEYANKKFLTISKIFGGTTSSCGIEKIHALLKSLNKICSFPLKLSDIGVKKQDFERISEMTLEDGTCIYNPRPIEQQDVIDILEKAYI